MVWYGKKPAVSYTHLLKKVIKFVRLSRLDSSLDALEGLRRLWYILWYGMVWYGMACLRKINTDSLDADITLVFKMIMVWAEKFQSSLPMSLTDQTIPFCLQTV